MKERKIQRDEQNREKYRRKKKRKRKVYKLNEEKYKETK